MQYFETALITLLIPSNKFNENCLLTLIVYAFLSKELDLEVCTKYYHVALPYCPSLSLPWPLTVNKC